MILLARTHARTRYNVFCEKSKVFNCHKISPYCHKISPRTVTKSPLLFSCCHKISPHFVPIREAKSHKNCLSNPAKRGYTMLCLMALRHIFSPCLSVFVLCLSLICHKISPMVCRFCSLVIALCLAFSSLVPAFPLLHRDSALSEAGSFALIDGYPHTLTPYKMASFCWGV